MLIIRSSSLSTREFLDCLDRSSLLIKESDKKPIKLTIEDNMLYLKIDSLIGSMNEEIEIHKEEAISSLDSIQNS